MQIDRDDSALAAAIRARLPTDRYLFHMVKPLGVSLGRLIACCHRHGIRYPNRHATDAEIRAAIQAVTIEGLSIREAACRVGISRTAVHRYVLAHRRAYVSRAGDFNPLRVKPYRCPRHGIVSISPCIACEALAKQGKL